MRRLIFTIVAAAAAAASLAAPQARADGKPKVVVLGFDGADSRLVAKWIDEGKLPNLAKLRDEGTFAPLQPTNPPQTPVSWSTFATGTSPGKTEIFDFLKREPGKYIPTFAMIEEGKRTFLFGKRNALVLGLGAGAGIALLLLLIMLPLRKASWVVRASVALVVGAGAGYGAGSVAAKNLPVEVPTAVNNRKGETMWELASRAGKRVQVIRAPATFPAEEVDGNMISGLGVPDMRGRVGTPAFYTSDPTFQPGGMAQEFSLELVRLPARRGKIETRVIGPANKPFYDYVVDQRTRDLDPRERTEARRRIRQELDDKNVPRRIDLPMTLDAADDSLTITLSGRSETLRVGQWSDWFVLDFPVNWVVDKASPLTGMVRLKLLKLDPEVELYLSPINFHPDCHPIAHSWPPEYAGQIAKRFGLYKTIGWPEDTWSLPSGVGDERLFLEDMEFTLAKDEQIMKGLLGDGKDDLYIQIFYFTDRIGHLFWRFLDEGHPLYDPKKAAQYAPKVLEAYQRMDTIVGEARKLADPNAVFIVCSDHGFSSFRRGVNYNTWLAKNGFMALKGQGKTATLEDLFDSGDLFANVDWSRTKAYALGLGAIYVNLVGREPNGVVLPGAEYDDVRRKIKEGLEALVDEKTGEHPVTKVWTREEMYSAFNADLMPDLRAGSNLNYRVSWQTTLGGGGKEVVEDNGSPWSGDHCSNDPELVHGIFFINRKLNRDHPAMVDVAPTVLKALGLAIPARMDGKPLL